MLDSKGTRRSGDWILFFLLLRRRRGGVESGGWIERHEARSSLFAVFATCPLFAERGLLFVVVRRFSEQCRFNQFIIPKRH